MKAVVLAAGKGVRLEPLTETRPKHLLPVGGKPILLHVVEALKEAGITEAAFIVHYMAEKIKQTLSDGSNYGMKFHYVTQPEPLGTGDAVLKAEEFTGSEDFLLVYGDLYITSGAVKRIIDAHAKHKPAATMAVIEVDQPEHYGVVKLDGNNVSDILEKPHLNETQANLVNAGLYAFSKRIFSKTKEITKSQRGELELTDALRLLIQQEQQVLGIQLEKQEWYDIGKPWDLLKANRLALENIKHSIEGVVEEGVHINGPVIVARDARVRSGAYIEGPVIIDSGSDIGPNCYVRAYTSIGRKVRVGNACEVKNSILMDGTHVGHLSYVGDSILGENCNLGAGTTIANLRLDEKTVKMLVKNKVTDTKQRKLGVVFGDGVKTGVNSSFMPGVKVGADSLVGAGAVVYRDLPRNSIVILEQRLEQRGKASTGE